MRWRKSNPHEKLGTGVVVLPQCHSSPAPDLLHWLITLLLDFSLHSRRAPVEIAKSPFASPTPPCRLSRPPHPPLSLQLIEMVKPGFLAMTTDAAAGGAGMNLLQSDLRDMATAASGFLVHAISLADGESTGGAVTHILKFVAALSAIYLLILDRTNWQTRILTALLIPYIFLTLPSVLFSLLRGEVGMWIAFVAVVLRLFFPKHFPDWLELPGSLILLLVVAPGLFADTIRGGLIGTFICLIIGCYLLQEHIRASGGFRNSFTRANGISNSIGIVLLFAYPVWALVLIFL